MIAAGRTARVVANGTSDAGGSGRPSRPSSPPPTSRTSAYATKHELNEAEKKKKKNNNHHRELLSHCWMWAVAHLPSQIAIATSPYPISEERQPCRAADIGTIV